MSEVVARTTLARSWSTARHAAICVVAIAFLFPFAWMVSTALRTDREVFAVPPRLLPEHVQWHNFVDAWEYLPFGTFFLNSAFVAASVTAIVLVVSSLAGYAFARLRFGLRETIFAVPAANPAAAGGARRAEPCDDHPARSL